MQEKIILAVLIGLVVVTTAMMLARMTSRLFPAMASEDVINEPEIIIGNGSWKVEVADNVWDRSRGLSGRKSLAEDRGMLFIFDRAGIYNFWMRGMKFPLDFVWIKSTERGEGVVLDITENAPPASFGRLKFYYSSEPTDLVLEINAGDVAKYGIRVGDRVQISNF